MPVSILFNFTVTLPRILKKVKKMDNSVTKKRAQSNEIDMLNGPLFKKILLFALPLAASSCKLPILGYPLLDGRQSAPV